MEIGIIIIASIILLFGLLGCILPILPGPPLCYASILIIHFFTSSKFEFSTTFLATAGIFVVIVTVLDLWFQVYGVKKFGGTKMAKWGAVIGIVIGLFFAPFGLIIGPFFGAFIGEVASSHKSLEQSFKVALGALVGFMAGTLLKIVVGVYITFYYLQNLIG